MMDRLMEDEDMIIDYKPIATVYSEIKKEHKKEQLYLLEYGRVDMEVDINEKLDLPSKIYSKGEIYDALWMDEDIDGSLVGEYIVEGILENRREKIYCIINIEDRANEKIYFQDRGLEYTVRSIISKKKGQLYYNDVKDIEILECLAHLLGL